MIRRSALPLTLLALLFALLALSLVSGGCSEGDTVVEDQAATASPAPAMAPAPTSTQVRLVISRDYGAASLKDVLVEIDEPTDVMRVLTENAEVESADGFVSAVDGLASTDTAAWFYAVDGLLADIGAAEYTLDGGETVWWDHHRWDGAMFAGTAVHAFPVPWAGRSLPVTSDTDFAGLAEWAAAGSLELGARRGLSAGLPDDGLVVCTAEEAWATPWLVELLSAEAAASPVAVDGGVLSALDMYGTPVATGRAAIVALPNAADPERPLLLVLLSGADAAAEAFELLTPAALGGRHAVGVVDGDVVVLPLQAAP
ncbi:MAG: DUF4430 domain-containing protein [Thermoleophilia bacterium]|nr:DUF4430 domain-containing protein [Thermoleophilia bacterium]